MTQSMLNLCHYLMIILKYKIISKPSLWLVTTEGDNRWGITAKAWRWMWSGCCSCRVWRTVTSCLPRERLVHAVPLFNLEVAWLVCFLGDNTFLLPPVSLCLESLGSLHSENFFCLTLDLVLWPTLQ